MRPRILFAGLVAAGLVAGCGGGAGGYPSATKSGSGGTGGMGGTGGGSAPTASVTIGDFSFSPTRLTVKVGTVVTWTNYGGAAHTSTSDNSSWDSGQIPAGSAGTYGMAGGVGGSYSHTFGTAGTYAFHCANHSQMTGTITVTP
jgi:plastocyanin